MKLSEYFWRKVDHYKTNLSYALRIDHVGRIALHERKLAEHEDLLARAEELEALEARVKAGDPCP